MENITIDNSTDVLIDTIHNQYSVVEVYFNEKDMKITELKHLSHERIRVYQYNLDAYLTQMKGYRGIDQKIEKAITRF